MGGSGWVVTRAEAHAAGLDDRAIGRRLAGGLWQRVFHGVYATHSGPITPDQRQVAALAYLGAGAMLTGQSALCRHGLRAADERGLVHVLVPDATRGRPGGFVVVTRTGRPPRNPDLLNGMCVAPVVRAVVDACRRLRSLDRVRALVAEAVQRDLCTVGSLAEELAQQPSAGTRLARQALAEVGANAHSVPEITLARRLRAAGVRGFAQNADIRDDAGRWLARGDFVWRTHRAVAEVDSVAYHLSPADQWHTQRRHNRLEAAGWAVLHYAPHRIRTDPAAVVAEIAAFLAIRARLIS
jgi:very-short-patch-repair endonuclease